MFSTHMNVLLVELYEKKVVELLFLVIWLQCGPHAHMFGQDDFYKIVSRWR